MQIIVNISNYSKAVTCNEYIKADMEHVCIQGQSLNI